MQPNPRLVLSLFPGIDLLGRGFTAAGFCVVKGPDIMWDEKIEDFVGATGFAGVIGGPPCVNYSDANRNRNTDEGDRLVRHFLRIVQECDPTWWVMENVRNVPDVKLQGYQVQRLDVIDIAFGGTQRRLRHIQFGHKDGWIIRPRRFNPQRKYAHVPALLTAITTPTERHCRRCDKQGVTYLPLRSLTTTARHRTIGNGVPIKTAKAIAIAVKQASPRHAGDCICGCGRPVTSMANQATAACRKRMQRRRDTPTRWITVE